MQRIRSINQRFPRYSKIVYGKKGFESIKFSNLKFDLNFILSILSNAPRLIEADKWAILMTVLRVFVEIKHCKISLSPLMGIIVDYLYNNGYHKEGRTIEEEMLKNKIRDKISNDMTISDFDHEFTSAINELLNLRTINMTDGNIQLLEEVTV